MTERRGDFIVVALPASTARDVAGGRASGELQSMLETEGIDGIKWQGDINGAVESGQRAAAEIEASVGR